MKDNKYKELLNEFEKNYREKIFPNAKKSDNERKIIFVIIVLCLGITFLTGFLLIEAINKNYFQVEEIIIIHTLFLVIDILYLPYLNKKFEKKVKKNLMPYICSCFGRLSWAPSTFSGDGKIYFRANLLPYYADAVFDDGFSGYYNNINYKIEEFLATTGAKASGNTVFNGIVISLEMNKKIRCHTIIKPAGFLNSSDNYSLHRTVLEDVVFEKKFDVYTDDDVEARYLITTAFIERLNNIKLAFNVRKISAAFYEGKFFIALPKLKDFFKIGFLTKPVYEYKQYKKLFDEIYSIYALIDYFKLDQRIGL